MLFYLQHQLTFWKAESEGSRGPSSPTVRLSPLLHLDAKNSNHYHTHSAKLTIIAATLRRTSFFFPTGPPPQDIKLPPEPPEHSSRRVSITNQQTVRDPQQSRTSCGKSPSSHTSTHPTSFPNSTALAETERGLPHISFAPRHRHPGVPSPRCGRPHRRPRTCHC